MKIFDKTRRFIREVLIEVRKVTWPDKKELISSTLVVIVLVFFVALYIGLVDFVLSHLLGVLLQ
ncbi:MAG: preprotein translocase subunit SecE [Elusimicrobiota bacterium]